MQGQELPSGGMPKVYKFVSENHGVKEGRRSSHTAVICFDCITICDFDSDTPGLILYEATCRISVSERSCTEPSSLISSTVHPLC